MQENNVLLANIKAEQGVLGALITTRSSAYSMLQKINFLQAKHFYEPVHQRIFSTILEFAEKGLNPTAVTLANYFEKDGALSDIGGSEYLVKLSMLSTAVLNLKSYATEIVENYTRKELYQVGNWLVSISQDFANKTTPEIISSINNLLEKIVSDSNTHEILTSRQVSENITDSFKEKLKCFITGIPTLDVAMGGGLYEGKAYGMAARKKTGKTVMASTISYNLNLQGIKHLFIATEMSPVEIQQRNIARGINRNSIAFIAEDRQDFDFQNKVAQFAIKDPGNIYYLHIPGISFDELKRNVALAIYKYDIKGFILDYFQLVRDSNDKRSKVEFFDEVAQWIANFCRQEKLWAFVTAQINQEDNIRWGEGLRLAFDQVYHLQAAQKYEGMYFIDMMDTRYTPWTQIGTEDWPIIRMEKLGPYFSEVDSG